MGADVRSGADTIRVAPEYLEVFDPDWMDEEALKLQGLMTGQPSAGRGNTWFFEHDNTPMVLRHYRRGGLVQRISKQSFIWTGLESTRAMAEFSVLRALLAQQLPVTPVVAVRVKRLGWRYHASIITQRVEGATLAEKLKSLKVVSTRDAPTQNATTQNATTQNAQKDSAIDWSLIGSTIADFHAVGLWHADLNAHNILIDDSARVTLLDFDRARLRHAPRTTAEGWSLGNLQRLHRSLKKVCASLDTALPDNAWMQLKAAWRESLMARQRAMR